MLVLGRKEESRHALSWTGRYTQVFQVEKERGEAKMLHGDFFFLL